MISILKQIPKYLITNILFISLIFLSVSGYTNKALDALGLEKLSQSNDRYLDSSFKRTITTFGILSAIKVGLAIVEGTEIGVGFGLQVGDAVQAVYDYVDLAWRTVLASAAVLLGTRYLLETADLVDQWFLVAMLILIYLMLLIRWFFPKLKKVRRSLRDITLLMTVFTISVYVILPLSIAGGSFLSKKITAPSIQEAESGFTQFREDLFPENKQDSKSIWSKITSIKDRLIRITSYLTAKTSALITWVLKLIAGYIFDCVIFPLILFVFLVWFTKLTAKYFFNIRRDQTFREDLEAIFDKYYSRSDVTWYSMKP